MKLAVKDVVEELGHRKLPVPHSTGGRVTLFLLDEFQVSDTFTAIALKSLFEVLWDANKDYQLTKADIDHNKKISEKDKTGSITKEDERVRPNSDVTIVVSTSNRDIDDDNDITSGLGGDHMERLLPKLREHMISVSMRSNVDWRQEMLLQDSDSSLSDWGKDKLLGSGVYEAEHMTRMMMSDSYFVEIESMKARESENPNAFENADDLWENLTGDELKDELIDISYGRSFSVPRMKRLSNNSVDSLEPSSGSLACWIPFDALFDDVKNPMGVTDYTVLAKKFDLFIVSNVPVMTRKTADKARRFINFIDELYNNRSALVLSSHVEVDSLFKNDNSLNNNDSSLLGEEADSEHSLYWREQEQQEQLQFENEPEEQRLRMDVTAYGGRAILSTGPSSSAGTGPTSSVTATTLKYMLSGEDERFAFRRSVSRLKEMRSKTYKRTSRWTNVIRFFDVPPDIEVEVGIK